MIRTLTILIGCFYMVTSLSAQEKPCTTIKKTYPNLLNQSIIANSPHIDRAVIGIENKSPISLVLLFKSDSTKNTEQDSREYYDLEFEGDRYLFTKKYNEIAIPVLPKQEVDYMASLKQCEYHYNLNATVYKDSVVYQFSQCCPTEEENIVYFGKVRLGAVYTGNLKQLAKDLEKKYNEKVHQPAGDSVLIFSGYVNRDTLNNLERITLIQGVKSPFSDFIQQGLEGSGKLWAPMIQGSRHVRSFIKIFARLNSDDSITLSASK